MVLLNFSGLLSIKQGCPTLQMGHMGKDLGV